MKTFHLASVALATTVLLTLAFSCTQRGMANMNKNKKSVEKATADLPEMTKEEKKLKEEKKMAQATFGGGCFWCVEAVYERLEGVKKVISGYAGGHVKNPTYEQVCSKTTGHAEVTQITYDPAKITFKELLKVFFKTHDPTTKNRQGNDVGPQYRSIILYHNEGQKKMSEKYKKALDESGAYEKPIVTEIKALKKFYKAEKKHQNYYERNPSQGYCRFVIQPKIEKFEKAFSDKLKKKKKSQ